MWWSKSVLMAGILTLGLAGCGFEPMYAKRGAPTSAIADELAGIRVAGIEDRQGQILRNALTSRMNPLGEPARQTHTLEVRLNSLQENMAERSDGKASLGRMQITANFHLTSIDGKSSSYSGISRSIVSYRLLGPTYGSTAVERDAESRALTDLAEDIRTQIATYFANGKMQRKVDP